MTPTAYGLNIIVKIDKAAQKKKAFISSTIQVPPEYEYMLYNLQYGEVVSVGSGINRPELRVGVKALFHHRIESEDKSLVHVYENGDQLRWVSTNAEASSYQYYGVIDEEGNVIPSQEYIFCTPAKDPLDEYEDYDVRESDHGLSGLGVGMRMKVKKEGILYLAKTFHKEEEEEKVQLEMTVALVPDIEKVLTPGDKILIESFAAYPLHFLGHEYHIVLRQFIIAKL